MLLLQDCKMHQKAIKSIRYYHDFIYIAVIMFYYTTCISLYLKILILHNKHHNLVMVLRYFSFLVFIISLHHYFHFSFDYYNICLYLSSIIESYFLHWIRNSRESLPLIISVTFIIIYDRIVTNTKQINPFVIVKAPVFLISCILNTASHIQIRIFFYIRYSNNNP